MFPKKLRLLSLTILMVAISGCASFEKKELARVDTLPDVSEYKNKPSVYVDLSLYHGDPGDRSMPIPRTHVLPIIEGAVSKSELFSEYSFDDAESSQHDYTIKIDVYNHGNKGAAFASGFITGFTFGVVPGGATDNYTLEMQAIDRNGQTLSRFSNKDSITTWMGIWFIPVMGNTPQKAVTNTLENQVMTALTELIESGVMKYSYGNYLLYGADRTGA